MKKKLILLVLAACLLLSYTVPAGADGGQFVTIRDVDGERIVEPVTGEPYLDREADFPYKIDHEDLCYQLFTEHGFEWGGDWEDRKDYQHFEIPTSQIEEWYP